MTKRLLNNEELFAKWKETKDSKYKDALVLNNEGLVKTIAQKYHNDFEDLLQEGYVGLLTAIDNFDPNRGVNFATCAYRYIQTAVYEYVLNRAQNVRLPQNMAEELMIVYKLTDADDLSYEEISSKTGISEKRLKIILDCDRLNKPVSLDALALFDHDGLQTVLDNCKDESITYEQDVLYDLEINKLWPLVKNVLTKKEFDILTQRMGYKLNKPKSLKKIGDELKMSHEGVRRIEKQALEKLRDKKYAFYFEALRDRQYI